MFDAIQLKKKLRLFAKIPMAIPVTDNYPPPPFYWYNDLAPTCEELFATLHEVETSD